mmetsp:Transcript_13124/g.27593  ORF Transcript_13124/g.27593 Transcript_13124/m.27593 type:complete len:94 (+) Transcript_13124:442-723(+)
MNTITSHSCQIHATTKVNVPTTHFLHRRRLPQQQQRINKEVLAAAIKNDDDDDDDIVVIDDNGALSSLYMDNDTLDRDTNSNADENFMDKDNN